MTQAELLAKILLALCGVQREQCIPGYQLQNHQRTTVCADGRCLRENADADCYKSCGVCVAGVEPKKANDISKTPQGGE